MKRIKNFFKNNVKVLVAFIVGGVIFGTIGVYAATVIGAGEVSYTNNSQTSVQSALDDLYQKASNAGGIDPSYIDFGSLAVNRKKTILASSAGICIKRNGTVSCFKVNNWAEEKNHIQQVFSDVSCYEDSSNVDCYASDFSCVVYGNGRVRCDDKSDNSRCNVYSDGSVYCS